MVLGELNVLSQRRIAQRRPGRAAPTLETGMYFVFRLAFFVRGLSVKDEPCLQQDAEIIPKAIEMPTVVPDTVRDVLSAFFPSYMRDVESR